MSRSVVPFVAPETDIAMAQHSPAIMDFVQRFESLYSLRDTTDELIKDILIYCGSVEKGLGNENARLKKELQDARLDLDDSRRSRRDLQTQLHDAQQQMQLYSSETESMRNRNPYVIVLIDGDGMIFKETLIRLGIEGGKQAATQLRNAILENYPEAANYEIQAKVCANITGLTKAMCRDGSLEIPEALKEFTLGFTQGKASFDFIDVGHGKERADSKIKECMRWHLRNHNCKQVLLGVSHDAGYAPFLDEVVTPDDRNRIAILEGPPAVRELHQTGIQILDFTNIFRAEKLTDRSIASPAAATNTWAGITSTPTPVRSPVPRTAATSSPIQPLPPPKPTKAPWTPEPRGLDSLLNPSSTVLEKLKRRTPRLCNNHYLRGPCSKGSDCQFEHKYKPSPEDLKAIAFLSRLNPCQKGQYCEAEDCIYGHHCPSVGKDGNCTAYACRFAQEDHPPGTTIKFPKKEREEKYY